MNTDTYIINKLLSNYAVKDFLAAMKEQGQTCYVAGGAMTAIATGNHANIADYDIYFSDVTSAVAAIRYMKEINPHVGFISDKSITYVINPTTKIQFIYYAFYPEATDIFKHFDFSINMMAYSNTDEKLFTQENFWMHNAQRYLHINKDTFYPILSNIRIQKYIDKGYHTSRGEILKLSLAIANLKIETWAEAKAQMGNSYGYTLADFKKLEHLDFSMEVLFGLLEKGSSNEGTAPSIPEDCYLYPIDAVDFVLLNKPIEVVEVNGKEYYVDEYAEDCDGLDRLIEEGTLQKVVVSAGDIFAEGFYTLSDINYPLDTSLSKGYSKYPVYSKANLPSNTNNKYVYEVLIEEDNVQHYSGSCVTVNTFTPTTLICRGNDLFKFKGGLPVEYRNNAKMLNHLKFTSGGWAYTAHEGTEQKRIADIKLQRYDHLKKHIIVVSKNPRHAHCTWSGIVVQGGEDITAEEVLLYMDDFNLCFGGNITLREDGTFTGSHNTD